MAHGAIDFGGGNTKMAIINRAGRAEAVLDTRGNKSMPTAVFVGPDNKVLVGQDALDQGLVHPQSVAKDFKRHLGTSKKVLGDLQAKDLVSLLVGVAKIQMEQQAGETIDGVVLTRPAVYGDAQAKDVVDAVERAGLKVIQVITEPSAAAYAATIRRQVGDRHAYVACIDLGSTTLDVTILEVKDGVASPVATEGVADLGGSNKTKVVEDLLLGKLSKELGKPLVKDKLSPEHRAELAQRAENAKIALSQQPTARVPLPAGGKIYSVELSQAEYHEAIKPLVQAVLACVDKAFASKSLKPQEMEMVVLAGAPMWSPYLQDAINKHLGVTCKIAGDPSLCVVEGAALHAAHVCSGPGMKGDRAIPEHTLKLREATSHDIGVAVVEESGTNKARVVNAVLLPKGTPIPCEIAANFRLERDNQTECVFEFFQGPDGTPVAQCAPLGGGQMKQLPVEPKRSPRIQIRIVVGEKSVAEITITDTVSGKSERVRLRLNERPGSAAA